METISGNFQDIRLGFTSEPPLEEEERYQQSANYPTTLAYLHIYLNGSDAATLVPSGYMLWILGSLLNGIAEILSQTSVSTTANWYSDPWRLDLYSNLNKNKVYLTLHIPERRVVIQNVCVPLDKFGYELIRISKKWLQHLDSLYHEEITDPDLGRQYSQVENYLKKANQALQKYKV